MPCVVSDEETASLRCQVGIRKANVSESLMTCRNVYMWHRNRGVFSVPGWVWRLPAYWPDGVRHGGDASLVCGCCMERGKACPDTSARKLWVVRGRAPSSRNC